MYIYNTYIYIVYLYIYTITLYIYIYTPEFNYLSSLSLSFVSRCFRDVPRWTEIHLATDCPGWSQLGSCGYGSIPMKIPFWMGWTSMNPSNFDVNYRGTRVWHTAMFFSSFVESSWKKHLYEVSSLKKTSGSA